MGSSPGNKISPIIIGWLSFLIVPLWISWRGWTSKVILFYIDLRWSSIAVLFWGIYYQGKTFAGTSPFSPPFFSTFAPLSLFTGSGGGCCPMVMALAFTYGGGSSGSTFGTGGNLGSYFSRLLTISPKSNPISGAFNTYLLILFINTLMGESSDSASTLLLFLLLFPSASVSRHL